MKTYLILLSILLGAQASAQQCLTLLYTGAPFTLVTTTGANVQAVTSPLTAVINLSAPLPQNGTTVTDYEPPSITGSTVANWNFGETYMYPLTNAPVGIYSAVFSFTMSNGIIVNWSMALNYNQGPATATRDGIVITSTVNGDSVAMNYYSPDNGGIGPATITGSSSSPGSWVCQQSFTADYPAAAPVTQAPVTPAPSTPISVHLPHFLFHGLQGRM